MVGAGIREGDYISHLTTGARVHEAGARGRDALLQDGKTPSSTHALQFEGGFMVPEI